MEAEVFPGDLLSDLLRAVGAVPSAFDPFDHDFAAEATAYEELAAHFVEQIRDEGVLRLLSSSYLRESFGLRRPGYPPERIEQLAKVMLPQFLPANLWQARGPVWYTSECSVQLHTIDEQIDTPVVFTPDGVFFEDPHDHEALMFHPWTNLAAHHLEKGPYTPRLVLMGAKEEPVYTIVPHGQSLAWQSFTMADAVLDMVFAALGRRGTSDDPRDADALMEWSTDAVTALLNADSTHLRKNAGHGRPGRAVAIHRSSGDMLVDFLQIAGMWPREIDPADRAFRDDLPMQVLAACESLFSMLESDPDLWLEVPPALGDHCGVISDEETKELLAVDRLEDLPGLEDYPWQGRGPLWYTSGVTIKSTFTGSMIFLRDGWVGVDPESPERFCFNSWEEYLTHRWPDVNGDGEAHESLMKLGDLELDFDTAGYPPWKALNLRLADILLRRILPVVGRSLGSPEIAHPPIGHWTKQRIRQAIRGSK